MISPFLQRPASDHVASNALAFALRDPHPVSPGHTLVIPRRLVATWFEATPEDQQAILHLVEQVRADLDAELHPDGYNIGIDVGPAAGQTVPHLHVHVIPRFRGEVDDPAGGVRHVVPSEGNHRTPPAPPLATGGRNDPFARHVLPLLERATEVAIVAAFVQHSGVETLEGPFQRAVARGAKVRIITGDYLGITQVEALERLHDWQSAFAGDTAGTLAVRVVEVARLPDGVRTFHPKAWRFEGPGFAVAFVGSSNLSFAALRTGVEWNLRVERSRDPVAYDRVRDAFETTWQDAVPLSAEWIEAYGARVRARPLLPPVGEIEVEAQVPLPEPHDAQRRALERLRAARGEARDRAMVVLATGLGKTILAALDYRQRWEELGQTQPPRLLFLAHRQELLVQAAGVFRRLAAARDVVPRVGWVMDGVRELEADLVFASVAMLARPAHLTQVAGQHFEYVVVDEVHHAAAASYCKILDAVSAGFLLGLTATPDRADGADVAGLFDDFVAYRAGLDEGIRLGRLVPFHYFGVKDSIAYENIPWRNRRFDPEALAAAAQTEARMQTLWRAWSAHPGARTLVFCCSVAHADFAGAWLEAQGVVVRVVHSGPGAADRSLALEDLAAGTVQAVCAVDVFNEGVDVPAVDRVVMLRPTESSVVFLQQLGRGLRAHPGKEALTVIDFVGNHRVFLERLRALLSLGADAASRGVHAVLSGAAPELPEGCAIELELEAKAALQELYRGDGANEVERAYRELSATRDERPRAGELFRMGYNPEALRRRHGGWFAFVAGEGDLSEPEARAYSRHRALLEAVEAAPMTRSFTMVTLQALVEADALDAGMPVEALAARCHRLLTRNPGLRAEVPEPLQSAESATSAAWRTHQLEDPIRTWTTGARPLFQLTDGRFHLADPPAPEDRDALRTLTAELVDLRMARYRRRLQPGPAGQVGFECRLTWNKRDPILKLPSRAQHDLPSGDLDVRLPDGAVWRFRLKREFCNVAGPVGAPRNQLPDLMRRWFGPSAGHPGTAFRVRFAPGPDGWSVAPADDAQVISLRSRSVAAYLDLKAAAGHAVGASHVHAAQVVLPVEAAEPEALFAVRVAGWSMDGGPKPLRDGDWAVFRLARGRAPAELEGRVVLAQVPTDAGPGFVVKRLRRVVGGWALASDHPEGPTFGGAADTIIIARLEAQVAPEALGPERGARLAEGELAGAFGVERLPPETGRQGGHLFMFLRGQGDLLSPTTVRAPADLFPGETAFVLARLEDGGWRYLGVARPTGGPELTLPEVDAETWRRLGSGGVSRPLPEGAEVRADALVAALLAAPEPERWIEQPDGRRARVLGPTGQGGLRIQGEGGRARTVSRTDLAWALLAADDVATYGGQLDEARVNRLRYLEGTARAATRWIDTGWALAAWRRVEAGGRRPGDLGGDESTDGVPSPKSRDGRD
jgi:superfamily II DNA or RNA helicase/diadenosine tetraphosphate (Ap4A) HIT family hydrolase